MITNNNTLQELGNTFSADQLREQYLKTDGKAPSISSSTVYHYTSLDVLNEMCKENGDLLCTHFMSLNDNQEFFLGLSMVLNQLERVLRAKKTKPDIIKLYQKNIWRNVLHFLRTEAIAPWITSFSDDPDSLYQWVAYTDRKDGGVAIGFDIELLREKEKLIQTNPGTKQTIGCRFEKCLYTDDHNLNSRIRRFLDEELNRTISAPSKYDNKQIEMLATVYILASRIKNPSFCQEKESRLIMTPIQQELANRYRFVGGKPRIATKFFGQGRELSEAITSVVISPHGDRAKLISAVNLLRQHLSLKFKIYLSSSSYNGR